MNDASQIFPKPKTRWSSRLGERAFKMVLDRMDAAFEQGGIEAILPDGSFRILGCRAAGPIAKVDLKRWRALLRLGQSGSIGWYQAWEKGEWTSPDPVVLFDLFMRNRVSLGQTARASGPSRLIKTILHKVRRNSKSGARRNIMAHYDLGNDFYACWLDETMTYSSAIFAAADETLAAAQSRKVDALLARLELDAGKSLLEIGFGWGFLSRKAAQSGARVTAITLSPAQHEYAVDAAENLTNAPDYQICDYRDVRGQFDCIASVEMVEAVGQEYWSAFLHSIANRLNPGGRAALQYISIADDVFDAYSKSADFIQAYIFPGGMLLSESRFRALAEARGLKWTDQTDFGLDYAETLKRWRHDFDLAVTKNRLPPQFDARFVQLWRYYLMYCEGGFRSGGINVAQVTLIKD